MSSGTLLGGIPISRKGLNYLVPSQWWETFQKLNRGKQPHQFQVPPLSLNKHCDSFLLQFKQELKEELEAKSNYLHFTSIRISPEIDRNIDWTPINPQLWKIISRKNRESLSIFTFGKYQQHIKTNFQVRIVFCSRVRSDAFVGFLPRNSNLAEVIREVGYEMGFYEVTKSKVSFLDRNPEISFSFHEIEKYSLQNAPGTSFMAFNLERKEEQEVQRQENFLELLANESNEAVMGDLNTEVDQSNRGNNIINNRTMSTGADTPFSLVLSEGFDLDRQYRVKELFGSKEPEEIEDLRLKALEKINSQKEMIELPVVEEKEFKVHLDKLADQLLEVFLKKKTPKEKEKQFQICE